ncbi:glycosyltransferase [Azospirillum tabaci]|uniref:glycosyltransferase n=1 Tax=Azospirillum tabaci TaxID=2752310 RepID=UPI0016615677|nr:glycosyltransferase [Azospirillum tabaci]
MPVTPPLSPEDLARYREAEVIFVAQDGFKLAPARVRCYSFARLLEQRSIRAAVLSFYDHLGAADQGGPVLGIPEDDKLRLNLRAAEILSQNPNAILYVQKTGYHTLSCFLAAARNDNPIILDYDDYDVDNRSFPRLEAWLPNLKPDQLLANTATRAAACVVSSRRIFDLVAPHNPNTHLIHTVADQETFHPRGRSAPRRRFGNAVNILWCGDVWGDLPMKDIFFGVDAFALVPAGVRRNARFHIIGFGKAWEELKRRLRHRYPDMDNLVFHEHIPPSEFGNVLAEMDIGILPYDANPFNTAKSPTKMFEYLLAKVAVCATPVGEAVHCLEHGRTALFGQGLMGFSEQLARLIAEPTLLRSIADAAHELAIAKYSLQGVGNRLVSIVRAAMARRDGTASPDESVEAFVRNALGRTQHIAPRELFLARQDLHGLTKAPDLSTTGGRRWSAPLIAMLGWPRLADAEKIPAERVEALRASASALRVAARLRPEIALPGTARPDGPPKLCKLAAAEDWEDPSWFAWVRRFKTNCSTFYGNGTDVAGPDALPACEMERDAIYSYFKRSRGAWERVQILYGLDRLGLLSGDARFLVLSEHVDGLYLFLTQWSTRVDVLDIGDEAPAMAERVARGGLDLWLLRPRLFDRRRLTVHHGAVEDGAFDERRWDAVVAPRNVLFNPTFPRVMDWAAPRLTDGGVLAFAGDVRLNAGSDAPGLSITTALEGLGTPLLDHTGFRMLDGFDPSLSDATLDRMVETGAADAENPHFIIRTGKTLHMPAVWFARKSGNHPSNDWHRFSESIAGL